MNTPSSPTAVIADDEPHLARQLGDLLGRLWPELQIVATARNGVDAAAAIAQAQPTLAFLDIRMPGLTGLEVAQGIEGETRVVFVTAYDEFAVQAFEQEALDYVLKPIGQARLTRTVERLKRALAAADDSACGDAHLAAALKRLLPGAATAAPPLKWVRASVGELTHQVAVDSVLYFHADDKYTVVQTEGAEYLIRTPIFELAAQLDPGRFAQIHRSTIVNLEHVSGTRRDEASRLFVRIRGVARELPVSRAYVHLFKAM
jgi:DNA-binding LytR/AlgR family response regulator